MFENTIFDQLKKEHKTVKSLLKKAESCAVNKRAALLEEIEQELVPHARGEEKTLYAVVLKSAKAEGREETINLTNEAYQEHHVVDDLLSELKNCSVNDEKWLAMLKVIKENLEHHIDEEENDLFPKAKKLLTEGDQDKILRSYNEAKEEYKDRLPTQNQIKERSPRADLHNT